MRTERATLVRVNGKYVLTYEGEKETFDDLIGALLRLKEMRAAK